MTPTRAPSPWRTLLSLALPLGMAAPVAAQSDLAAPQAPTPVSQQRPAEAASPDVGSPAAASPDLASPEAAAPEAGSSDAAAPEAAPSEAASPDLASSAAAAPEAASPDLASPEAAAPEAGSSDAAAPEAAPSEAAPPEPAPPEAAPSKAAPSKAAPSKAASPEAAPPNGPPAPITEGAIPPGPGIFQAGWFGARDVAFSVGGSYRISAEGLTDMRTDAAGRLYEQNALVTHRLRWQPAMRLGDNITLEGELQVLSGHLYHNGLNPRFVGFGPPRGPNGEAFASLDAYADELALRKLFLTWTTPIGQLRLGRQSFQWGLGILSNAGEMETQDWGVPRFGPDRDYGDIVDRVLFITAPLALLSGGDASEWARRWQLAFGGDVLVRDERVFRDQGDLALQAVGALRYAEEDPTTGVVDKELGVFVAHRHLNDRNQDTLTVTAFDLFGRGAWRWGDVELFGAGEVVWVVGDTTLAQNNAFLSTKVQQLGWLARAGAIYLPWGLGGDVEVGYASGDSNPNDQFLRNFTFDPDYNPSLILFDQLYAAQTVAAAANASDPSQVGIPPSAARLLPTGGGMTNAVYVRPTVRFAWEGFAARFAFLWAMAPQDIVDPYNSNATGGGTAVNFQGGSGTNRDLGIELDLGVDYTYKWDSYLEVSAGLQGGYLFPGAGFADASGNTPDPIGMVFGRVILTWLPADPSGPPRE